MQLFLSSFFNHKIDAHHRIRCIVCIEFLYMCKKDSCKQTPYMKTTKNLWYLRYPEFGFCELFILKAASLQARDQFFVCYLFRQIITKTILQDILQNAPRTTIFETFYYAPLSHIWKTRHFLLFTHTHSEPRWDLIIAIISLDFMINLTNKLCLAVVHCYVYNQWVK